MPHVNSSGGDDLASTDEVKVYKDEGEEEKRSSENLSEEKLGLVTETEEVGWALHSKNRGKSWIIAQVWSQFLLLSQPCHVQCMGSF